MDKPVREAQPHFSQPVRQVILMMAVVVLVGAGGYVAYAKVSAVFLANPWLNGFIGFVFVMGVLACFWQVLQLISSVSWIEDFAARIPGHENVQAPRLLAPLAALLRARGALMQISSTSSRSILDSVATRIDEARDITRYLVNLLIFLGLLGTFYGLATTVPAVVETIRSLAPQEGDTGIDVFEKLMGGLEAQLGGMGTAFSSSLLGLAGSLVVGLLELFASHGQNRFYRELEEWLSSITRLGFSAGEGDGETGGDAGAAIEAIVEHMAAQLDALQTLVERSDEGRSITNERLDALAEAMTTLAGRLEPQPSNEAVLNRIADGQERVLATLQAQAESAEAQGDAESRMRLRSIDVQLLRILEEISAGRQESTADLRGDISSLTAAIRQLSRSNTGRG